MTSWPKKIFKPKMSKKFPIHLPEKTQMTWEIIFIEKPKGLVEENASEHQPKKRKIGKTIPDLVNVP